MIFELFEALKL